MKTFISVLVAVYISLFTSLGHTQECVPPPGGKCLTKEQLEEVKKALQELKQIHEAPANLQLQDPLIIVHDWEGRVYVNGGESKPVRMKLTLGDTVDRDMAVLLPTQVYYRPKPPDPMFRLRIRAQAGVLVPQLIQSASGDGQRFWDVWASFDFFHIDMFNFAVNAGVNSASAGLGLDLTKNFGLTAGYAFIYDGLRSSVFTGMYFSFN